MATAITAADFEKCQAANEVNVKVCELLGIDPSTVASLKIMLRPWEHPRVECVKPPRMDMDGVCQPDTVGSLILRDDEIVYEELC